MGSARIVEVEESVERPLQLRTTGEELPTKRHASMLMENRALEAFDKAVGPRMPGFRARMPDGATGTPGTEGALELLAPVREDALQRPAGSLMDGANGGLH